MKRNKLTKRLTAFIMASVLPFTSLGCQKKPSQQEIDETYKTLTQIADLTNESLLRSIENNETLEKEKVTQKEKCRISAKSCQFIDNFIPEYNYEELYPTKEELEVVLEEHSGDLECTYQDSELDVFDLVFKIEENTKEYLKVNSEYKNIFSEDIEYLNTSMISILYRIFSELKEKVSHNLKEDFCRLSSLKIVIGETEDLGLLGRYILEENLIVLYLDNIKLNLEENLDENIICVIKHELNHVYQIKCLCQDEEKYYSLSIDWDEEQDAFITSYIEEAAAESCVYNVLNDDLDGINSYSYSYSSERAAENLMLTLGLTSNPESSIEDYYATIFDTDLVEYCNFLGATNLDEKQRFLKIDYAINASFGRNHLLDNVENKDFRYETKKEVGEGYLLDVFKWNIQNLIDLTVNEDIALEENLLLYYIVKVVVTNGLLAKTDCVTNDDGYFLESVYSDYFTRSFKQLDDAYLNYLAIKYNTTKSDIKELERTKIKDRVDVLSEISSDLDIYTSSITREEKKIIDNILLKYPLIEPIMRTNERYDNYYNFLEETNNKDMNEEIYSYDEIVKTLRRVK